MMVIKQLYHNKKIPDQEGSYYLTFTFDGAPFAEIKYSVDGADIILLKWFDFVQDYMGISGSYYPQDDNLPNYDVLTDEERENYQKIRLRYPKQTICGELYNVKYVIYKDNSTTIDGYLGKDTKTNKTFVCFDRDCKKPIINVSLDTTYISIMSGKQTTGLKVLRYVDPTFNSAPKNLVPIN